MKLIRWIAGLLLLFGIFASSLCVIAAIVKGGDAWAHFLGQVQSRKFEALGISAGALFLGLIYVLAGIRVPDRARYLAYDLEGGGAVSISLKALQNFVARLSDEFSQVVKLKPELRAVNGAVDVQLDISVKAGAQIPELSQMLQKRTRECIKENIGLADVRDVRVRVQEIVPAGPADRTPNPESKAI